MIAAFDLRDKRSARGPAAPVRAAPARVAPSQAARSQGAEARRRAHAGGGACAQAWRRHLIEEGLGGKRILITGSTGFLGKSLVEKLLRSLPSVGRINLGIRSSARRPALDRLDREVLSSPAFRRLK